MAENTISVTDPTKVRTPVASADFDRSLGGRLGVSAATISEGQLTPPTTESLVARSKAQRLVGQIGTVALR